VHTAVLAGGDPVIMLTAPIPASEKALQRSGLSIDEIGAIQVNETFAPVPLAWPADLDAGALNPNGGAIALGHPLGGSGARLMTDDAGAPHARQRNPLRAADDVRGRR
jgi:acetyl-CoA acyltransferase